MVHLELGSSDYIGGYPKYVNTTYAPSDFIRLLELLTLRIHNFLLVCTLSRFRVGYHPIADNFKPSIVHLEGYSIARSPPFSWRTSIHSSSHTSINSVLSVLDRRVGLLIEYFFLIKLHPRVSVLSIFLYPSLCFLCSFRFRLDFFVVSALALISL